LNLSPSLTNPHGDLLDKVMAVAALLTLVPVAWLVYRSRGVSFRRFVDSLPGDFPAILKEENCRAIILRYLQRLNELNVDVERNNIG
jgi:hypothetical protein